MAKKYWSRSSARCVDPPETTGGIHIVKQQKLDFVDQNILASSVGMLDVVKVPSRNAEPQFMGMALDIFACASALLFSRATLVH